ncbi:glycosyltransferase family 2 protein [Patescibacteria group bacterium]|nr:glycosyltransferase family 2 protein [Patescibacteria group bacterium]MBU1951936.1 glycosyltransferase family 2 protein [Patescibacteria group bacterium]MBU2229137.1 glycosyltransferase family 2 protein [Patescibacteria group bacterium]
MKKVPLFKTLSLVIPVYNEEKRIKESLKKIVSYLNDVCAEYEIIIVDDGSSDKTQDVVKEMATDRFRIILVNENRGKGYAVKKGMLVARYEYVLFSDADLSTPIEELEKFSKHIENFDIIIGSRAMKDSNIEIHQPWFKEFLGRVGNKVIQFMLLPGIQDTQCGFKLFNKKSLAVFEKQTINRWGFDFEILWLAKKMGFRIKEIPVRWINDFGTKVSGFSHYINTFTELLKIRWNSITNKYNLQNNDRDTNI